MRGASRNFLQGGEEYFPGIYKQLVIKKIIQIEIRRILQQELIRENFQRGKIVQGVFSLGKRILHSKAFFVIEISLGRIFVGKMSTEERIFLNRT